MMTSMASGKMPGMPGLPGMGGGAKKQPAKAAAKKKGHKVSGNPAKRNNPAVAAPAAGSAFEPEQLDEKALQEAMASFQLPSNLRDRLK